VRLGWVLSGRLRGVAWVSGSKDVLVLGAILFAGIVIPVHFFGSPVNLFAKLREAHPDWLTFAVQPLAQWNSLVCIHRC